MDPAERRVVAALDASSVATATAAAAVDLAVALQGRLSGVFVEDVELVRAAMLPFSRLVHETGESRSIDPASMEEALRAAVARAKDDLERAAALARLAFSFRVARGAVLATLREEARQRDLVVVGSANRIRATLATQPDSVRPSGRAAPLAVMLGEPRQDDALLAAVELLVRAQGGPVRVFRRAALPDLAAVASRVAEERARALLVDLGDPWISEASLRMLRRRVACPIILVR